jgi:hypothetical protein
LQEQKAAWTERKALKERLLALKEEDLPHILEASGLKLRGENPAVVDGLLIDILGIDPEKHSLRRDELRGVLTTLVKRIELHPKTREYTIHYRLPVTGVKVGPHVDSYGLDSSLRRYLGSIRVPIPDELDRMPIPAHTMPQDALQTL